MAAKLPKPGHAPIVGRRKETFACVYVIEAGANHVKVGACIDILRHLDELQRASPCLLWVRDLYWLPDLNLAKRVAAGAHNLMRIDDAHIRGEWFDVPSKTASAWVAQAARALNIPLISNAEYLAQCRSPSELHQNKIDNFERAVGLSSKSRT